MQLDNAHIIESVDSICRDSADTQYIYANTNKFLKISKTAKATPIKLYVSGQL